MNTVFDFKTAVDLNGFELSWLSSQLGISRQTLSGYYNGKIKNKRPEVVEKILKWFEYHRFPINEPK